MLRHVGAGYVLMGVCWGKWHAVFACAPRVRGRVVLAVVRRQDGGPDAVPLVVCVCVEQGGLGVGKGAYRFAGMEKPESKAPPTIKEVGSAAGAGRKPKSCTGSGVQPTWPRTALLTPLDAPVLYSNFVAAGAAPKQTTVRYNTVLKLEESDGEDKKLTGKKRSRDASDDAASAKLDKKAKKAAKKAKKAAKKAKKEAKQAKEAEEAAAKAAAAAAVAEAAKKEKKKAKKAAKKAAKVAQTQPKEDAAGSGVGAGVVDKKAAKKARKAAKKAIAAAGRSITVAAGKKVLKQLAKSVPASAVVVGATGALAQVTVRAVACCRSGGKRT